MAREELSREQALSLTGHKHACHIMLFSHTDSKLFGRIPLHHRVLMQMRFDGLLGFPGGLVNPCKESLESGLSRELQEELGVTLHVAPGDHFTSCLSPSTSNLVTHFFVKKLTEEELRDVEKAAVAASDHGHEVMGMVQVPLHFLKNGGGFPSFLSHTFISNSRSQLLWALHFFGLMSQEKIDEAIKAADALRQIKPL